MFRNIIASERLANYKSSELVVSWKLMNTSTYNHLELKIVQKKIFKLLINNVNLLFVQLYFLIELKTSQRVLWTQNK